MGVVTTDFESGTVGLGLSLAVKRRCAVNNRRPCRGNRARPNGAARPTCNDGSGSKSERTLQRAGITWSAVSLEAVVFTC